MSERDPADYRPCAGVMILNDEGKVFVGQRIDTVLEAWQMPQGGIDAGEAPQEAALRELYEETNVDAASVRLLAEAPDWLSYDLPTEIRTQAWRGRYRGQTQRWFAFAFLGEDDVIDVAHPGGGAHKAEFDAWRWVPFAELPGLIVPFKRPVYEGVVAAFAPLGTWSDGA